MAEQESCSRPPHHHIHTSSLWRDDCGVDSRRGLPSSKTMDAGEASSVASGSGSLPSAAHQAQEGSRSSDGMPRAREAPGRVDDMPSTCERSYASTSSSSPSQAGHLREQDHAAPSTIPLGNEDTPTTPTPAASNASRWGMEARDNVRDDLGQEASVSSGSQSSASAPLRIPEDSPPSHQLRDRHDHNTGNAQDRGTGNIDPATRTGTRGFATLVDDFVNGFRHTMAGQRGEQNITNTAGDAAGQAAEPAAAAEAAPPATESNAGPSLSADATTPPTGGPDQPRTLFFRMPLSNRNGQPAVLAFNPSPIPVPPDGHSPHPTYGADRPAHLGPERGNAQASGFHLPVAPIFVPHGASPLPFSFLFDAQTNTAWPIAAISYGPPGSMPPENPGPDAPQFMAGPPFHIALNIHFGAPPQPEQPDAERAKRFVASLERADAELRSRLARLGMGDIGGGLSGADALGCGICLDEYPTEDRPEWIGGQASIDEEVVGVPCAGHHTLHHRCLLEWLSNTPPSQWSCPFCRAPLNKEKVDSSASPSQQAQTQSQAGTQTTGPASNDTGKGSQDEAKSRTLREEVRFRERAHGWRCDSPACLPQYPDSTGGLASSDSPPAESIELITLLPCRHKLHLDCLCTSMKVEQIIAAADEALDDDEDDEVFEKDEDTDGVLAVKSCSAAAGTSGKGTIGKWVTCPTCRHEAWAELPVRQRSKRVEASKARIAAFSTNDDLTGDETADDNANMEDAGMDQAAGGGVAAPVTGGAGTKRTSDMPLSGAREQARLLDRLSQPSSPRTSHTASPVEPSIQSSHMPDSAPRRRRDSDAANEVCSTAHSDADVEALLS